MRVILPPDIEALAQQAARDNGYDNVADFVAETVRQSALGESLKQEQGKSEGTPAYNLPYPEWRKRFDEFLANRKSTNPNFDDLPRKHVSRSLLNVLLDSNILLRLSQSGHPHEPTTTAAVDLLQQHHHCVIVPQTIKWGRDETENAGGRSYGRRPGLRVLRDQRVLDPNWYPYRTSAVWR